MKIHSARLQSFSEHAPSFKYRISMDTKGCITPFSHNNSHIHVLVYASSHFVVTVPNKCNNAKTTFKTLLYHWIVKIGPPIYLVTDRGSEYFNTDMALLCSLMGVRHSPRTPYCLGLIASSKFKTKTSVHFRIFLQNTPKDWAHQVPMYAFADNSQHLPALNVSSHELVFDIRPRIPLTFDLNLNCNKDTTCISQYCSQLPEHFQYDKLT